MTTDTIIDETPCCTDWHCVETAQKIQTWIDEKKANGWDVDICISNNDNRNIVYWQCSRATGYLCNPTEYGPTEYRAAVARLASSLLWGYWRGASYYVNDGGLNVAHYIRKTAKGELGRGIASRWFN